jgi:hypothetical protein
MATHHQKPAIELTPKGAMVKLDKLYIYPDGHGNLTLRDGRNWPCNDSLEFVERMVLLFRQLHTAAKTRKVEVEGP